MTNLLHSASEFSPLIDHLALRLLIVCGFFVVLVWTLMIYFCIRYRASAQVNRSDPPAQNRKLEMILVGIMIIFGVTTFGFSAKLYYRMYTPPAEAREVFGVAKQWMWIFHNPEGHDEINSLTIPIGVPIKLTLISEDVVHSLFIPAFRVKQDVLPGRYTSLWFTATELGDFPLYCTQYCGLSHSDMMAMVHVVAHDQSALVPLSSRPPGEKLFREKGCASCHSSDASLAAVGPNLRGIYGSTVHLQNGITTRADDAYLRESILSPNAKIVAGYRAVMPTYSGVLNENEVRDLVDYLKQWKGSP